MEQKQKRKRKQDNDSYPSDVNDLVRHRQFLRIAIDGYLSVPRSEHANEWHNLNVGNTGTMMLEPGSSLSGR